MWFSIWASFMIAGASNHVGTDGKENGACYHDRDRHECEARGLTWARNARVSRGGETDSACAAQRASVCFGTLHISIKRLILHRQPTTHRNARRATVPCICIRLDRAATLFGVFLGQVTPNAFVCYSTIQKNVGVDTIVGVGTCSPISRFGM